MSYNAFIAKIDRIEEIPNAKTIQKGFCLGRQIIISKQVNIGDIGIFFPEDGQLSQEYCKNNNLFRDSEKNLDRSKQGFFCDKGKVKTQYFMKEKSEGYFAPLSSIAYTKVDISK